MSTDVQLLPAQTLHKYSRLDRFSNLLILGESKKICIQLNWFLNTSGTWIQYSAIYLFAANNKIKSKYQLPCCWKLKNISSVSLRKKNQLWDLSRQWLHHYSPWHDFTQERVIDLSLSGFPCLVVLFNVSTPSTLIRAHGCYGSVLSG